MTATRHKPDTSAAPSDVWTRIAAPLPPEAVSWRQDGKPSPRDGKFFARFVAYVDAHTVRERLDSVVPGEWDLSLEPLPFFSHASGEVNEDQAVSFKARLQILGVVRECVGSGPNYKEAATDAFKRAAVRFGVAHELYAMGANWVQVDSDSKYAKAIEDPWAAYHRRNGNVAARPASPAPHAAASRPAAPASSGPRTAPAPAASGGDDPACPNCGGRMYDNRESKRNPRAPDFKCRDRSCGGVIWPPRDGDAHAAHAPASRGSVSKSGPLVDDGPPPPDDDDLPF